MNRRQLNPVSGSYPMTTHIPWGKRGSTPTLTRGSYSACVHLIAIVMTGRHTHLTYTCSPCGCSLFPFLTVAANNTCNLFFFWQHCIITDSHTHLHSGLLWLTSSLKFLNAHVDHHGSLGVVCFDQRGEVAAVHLLDMPQVWLAVVRHDFGALLMDVQPTVWQRKIWIWSVFKISPLLIWKWLFSICCGCNNINVCNQLTTPLYHQTATSASCNFVHKVSIKCRCCRGTVHHAHTVIITPTVCSLAQDWVF